MGSFADQIAAFAAKAQESADAVVRESIEEVGRRLIDRTPRPEKGSPYATGRMASNWRYGLETADLHFSAETNVREVNGLDGMPKKITGFVSYVTNSAPYAHYVEFGTSKMSPQPMVGLTTLEWSSIVAEAAQKVVK